MFYVERDFDFKKAHEEITKEKGKLTAEEFLREFQKRFPGVRCHIDECNNIDVNKPKRKIVQIASCGHDKNQETQSYYSVVALCNDGTLWFINNRFGSLWQKYPEIPQD